MGPVVEGFWTASSIYLWSLLDENGFNFTWQSFLLRVFHDGFLSYLQAGWKDEAALYFFCYYASGKSTDSHDSESTTVCKSWETNLEQTWSRCNAVRDVNIASFDLRLASAVSYHRLLIHRLCLVFFLSLVKKVCFSLFFPTQLCIARERLFSVSWLRIWFQPVYSAALFN